MGVPPMAAQPAHVSPLSIEQHSAGVAARSAGVTLCIFRDPFLQFGYLESTQRVWVPLCFPGHSDMCGLAYGRLLETC